ncbi:neutral alpha-glucosidase AB [Plectosphaerella plurivora]|uniref:alpha-glucosidase n=1 Tax=Plectosphaerella plurivora TaxID=936078 RepID=A0A9P8VGP5_9PEZI|nr:neutral alpha-glucosidase AB [Plectosphaerella plurivora]
MRSGNLAWLLVACLVPQAASVKENDFKKCHQSGFCKRNRDYADSASAQGSSWVAPYSINPDTVSLKDGQLSAVILKTINDKKETVNLPVTVSFLESGTARVTIDEERRQNKDIELRHGSKARKERYNEVEKLAIIGGLELDTGAKITQQDASHVVVHYGPGSKLEAIIKFSPFSVDFKRDGVSHVKLNDHGLLNVEHWRPKVDKVVQQPAEGDEQKPIEGETEAEAAKPAEEDESTWWDETFGGNTDSKPKGPESIALDITFPGYQHVYGIPEHAGPLALKETRGADGQYSEPYRLYNSDVFEYILDSPMTLYGAIPFMQAHRKDSHVGVFWLNAAETWIDITKGKSTSNPLAIGAKTNTNTHWISEAGLIDVFVFLGPTPKDVIKSYTALTGTTAIPQEFAIAYHQCRWNYNSDDDVKDVDRKMDKFQIPYDIIWLDIEYTNDKMYFTWEPNMFKDPISMSQQLDDHGRQLVVIIDPHIKNKEGYNVVSELKSKDLAVRNKDGNIFDGWCWPGSSHWVDCFNPAAIDWWNGLFDYSVFKGTMENTFIWNDMNEPSVFNGPEVTMPKDNLHHGDWEHRDLHNLNGMTFHNATYQALLTRKKGELRRPFVLTRSFYSGSQRYGAMWTGDNQASWEHLAISLPMILNQGISGFPFSGSDVGGFFGNPDSDLMARWYQAGAFYPFFRGHAHIDARRREPYLLEEPYRTIVTAALRLRYSLMPSWYTAFYQSNQDGSPIVKPMFYTHPTEEGSFDIDDQLFLGNTGLLHKPVVGKDIDSVDIYIPDDEVYYDYFTYQIQSTSKGKKLTVSTPLEKTALLMRGGHIFPRRDTPRRSSKLMRFDDYTLVVNVGKTGVSEGELYADDGDSFDYEAGQYIHRKFAFDKDASTFTSTEVAGRDTSTLKRAGSWLEAMERVYVDKIIIVGAPASWKVDKVLVESGGNSWSVPVRYHAALGGRAAFAVVGRVGARIGSDFTVKLA